MDGNGRWAQARGHSRVFGHVRGAKVARQIIEASAQIGLENLTLFTFSTENWRRPGDEVQFLMTLLARKLKQETATLLKNNIRFFCIGDLSRLPKAVMAQVAQTIRDTAKCTGMRLTFALSYGGRQELAAAARNLAQMVKNGDLLPEDITEDRLGAALDSSFLPDPDLIIRTSGEMRLSNFFLWQAAYSELEFSAKAWPDFTVEDLKASIERFTARDRRFGQVSEQLVDRNPRL